MGSLVGRLTGRSAAGQEARPTRAAVVVMSLLLTSCARAPSVDILGSFFPVWMLCLTIGVFLTFGLRVLLLRTRMEAEVGPLALFYPCAVILFTGLLWLIFFR
jgi:YtcA-like protein